MTLTWELDGWIIVAGVLSAVSAALLGNFLVLRKMSLLGDAISHAVLPGLAVAFFVSDSRSSVPMFLGAVVVGLLTALFTEWIRGVGKVDEGASMGVVFTSLFALGLVMIVQAADQVDLDPGCVLYGAIELTPLDTWIIGPWRIPRVVVVLGGVSLLNLFFVLLFYKELKLAAFDPALSTSSGIPAWLMHYLLMMLVAVTAVASFEAVGNILVVAMLVVPPAAALMLTDRLGVMILLSAIIGAAAAVLGHLSALIVPQWFGFRSTSTAGMMAAMTGLLFTLCALFGWRHGILTKAGRRQLLAWRILREDVIGLLYRSDERNDQSATTPKSIATSLLATRISTWIALRWLRRGGLVLWNEGQIELTDRGRTEAVQLIRSHRLWETYLFSEAGLPTERVHSNAERLEHYTGMELEQRLSDETAAPQTDPHGSRIPNSQSDPPTGR
jgi:manganese/zinc/iron transport system permease protein